LIKPILSAFLIILLFNACQKEYYQYLAREKERSSLEFYYKALDFFETQELDSSLHYVNEALQIKPNYAPYYFLKGKIYHLKNDNERAIQFFEKALKNKSFYPDVWREIAPLYFQKDDFSSALKYYYKLMQNEPDILKYRLYVAICYNRLDRPAAAIDLLLPYLNRFSEIHIAYREVIFAYRLMKQEQKCIDYFEQYLRKVKDQPVCDVIEQILEIYLQKNELEKMLSNANKGLKICRSNPIWNYYRYLYFKRKGEEKLATIELHQIESKVKFQPSLLYFLGRYYYEKKNWQKSASYWSGLKNFEKIATRELEQLVQSIQKPDWRLPLLKELYRRTGDKKWKKELELISKGKNNES
jgi:tetratricopeptide (TPR) repeat protein